MCWLHWFLLVNGFFHMATAFSGFTWTLIFYHQKTELCVLSLIPKNNQGRPHKVQLDLPTRLRTILGAQGERALWLSRSSHFANPQGQGEKARKWEGTALPWPWRSGWRCDGLVYVCVFAWVFVWGSSLPKEMMVAIPIKGCRWPDKTIGVHYAS